MISTQDSGRQHSKVKPSGYLPRGRTGSLQVQSLFLASSIVFLSSMDRPITENANTNKDIMPMNRSSIIRIHADSCISTIYIFIIYNLTNRFTHSNVLCNYVFAMHDQKNLLRGLGVPSFPEITFCILLLPSDFGSVRHVRGNTSKGSKLFPRKYHSIS